MASGYLSEGSLGPETMLEESQESIEEFGRQFTCGVFQSPSPSPALGPFPSMEPSSLNNPEWSSTQSFTTGEGALTPSTSSSEDQQPSPLDVESFVLGTDIISASFQEVYPAQIDFSSPSSSSDGRSHVSTDGYLSNSPALSDLYLTGNADSSGQLLGNGPAFWQDQPQSLMAQPSYNGSTFSDTRIHLSPVRYHTGLSSQSSISQSYPQPQRLVTPQISLTTPMTYPPPNQLSWEYQTTERTSIQYTGLISDQTDLLESPLSATSSMQGPMDFFRSLSEDNAALPEYHTDVYGTLPVTNSRASNLPVLAGNHLPSSSTHRAITLSPQQHAEGLVSSNRLVSTPSLDHSTEKDAAATTPHSPPTTSRQGLSLQNNCEDRRQETPQSSQRVPARGRGSSSVVPLKAAESPEASDTTSPSARRKSNMKGGRKGSLARESRKEASDMRKKGACWPCTIMREKCSKGDPCDRCSSMSLRSKAHGLGCDRRQLKGDMMRSFIPTSMDPGQLYESCMAFIEEDSSGWCSSTTTQQGIKVPFSIGIGRPLEWVCHEYQPAPRNSSRNISWHINERGDHWRRKVTPSPPLAIKNLEPNALSLWMSGLLEQNLEDVGDMYFWEGYQLRTEIIKLLCQLYDSLRSRSAKLSESSTILRDDLRRVLSLILVTYVMNHSFTVEEELRDAVLYQLSEHNNPQFYADLLILKTANAQLHYGFSKLRYSMHLDLLNRLQQILKHARYKEWWLSAYVIMLGLALTLEEYQHLLHVQADSRIAHGNTTQFAEEAAIREATDHCNDIDDGFEFLFRLYHYKYSARQHTRASFAVWKDRTQHPAEERFVQSMPDLFAQHRIILLQRKDGKVALTGDNHVLRLVGRFLTSMM